MDQTNLQPTMPVATQPAMPTPVLPLQSGSVFSFQGGDMLFEVDSAVAGRIVTFALGGQNVLTPSTAGQDTYGSTFWTSPQSVWNWPPPTEINATTFDSMIEGGFVTLTGPASPLVGASVSKRFSMDAARQSVTLEYFIFNQTGAQLQVAPWEITRVAPFGLTFYGTGPGGISSNALGGVSEGAGATWFDYAQAPPSVDQKLFADGMGWLAHVSGNLLFIKQFQDVPAGGAAPGEGEIEIFANGVQTYVEIEQQGAFVVLDPGQPASWVVTWYLRQLPPGVTATAGSQSLVDFVNQVLSGNG